MPDPGHGERPVKPIDPSVAPTVRRLGETFTKMAETYFNSDHFRFKAYENKYEFYPTGLAARKFGDGAKEYSFALNRYWIRERARAADDYNYFNHGDMNWFRQSDDSLREVDGKLEIQLKAFEDSTSPYADEYDPGEIRIAGDELRRTVTAALEKFKLSKVIPGMNAQGAAEQAFNLRILSALAGLSEQIGGRLKALGDGKTVTRITMSSQTEELLNRSVKDVVAEQIAGEAKELQGFRGEFLNNDYSAASIEKMRLRQGEIKEELRDRSLSTGERQTLEAEAGGIDKALQALEASIDKVRMVDDLRRRIKQTRDDVTSIDRDLRLPDFWTPEERLSKLEKRAGFVKTLADWEARFVDAGREAIKKEADKSQDRSERYDQTLVDARAAMRKDIAGYWSRLKGDFLSEVETAAGEELRGTLDEAFGANLSEQLKTWSTESTKTHLDPVKLQMTATDLLAVLSDYSSRAELMTRGRKEPELIEAHDKLQCGLSAIRESVAKTLKFLFENGAFAQT